VVAKQKLRGAKSILCGNDVSRGSNNDDDDVNDDCFSSCERKVGKSKNDRSSSSSHSWLNVNDDEDVNDFRGTNGGGDNNENDDGRDDDEDGVDKDDGDNEDDLLVGDAKEEDGNEKEL